MTSGACSNRLECAYIIASSLIFFRGPVSHHDITSFAYITVSRGLVHDYWGDWRAVAGAVESPSLLIDIGRLIRKGILTTTFVDEYGVYVEKITLPNSKSRLAHHLLLIGEEDIYKNTTRYAYKLFRSLRKPITSY